MGGVGARFFLLPSDAQRAAFPYIYSFLIKKMRSLRIKKKVQDLKSPSRAQDVIGSSRNLFVYLFFARWEPIYVVKKSLFFKKKMIKPITLVYPIFLKKLGSWIMLDSKVFPFLLHWLPIMQSSSEYRFLQGKKNQISTYPNFPVLTSASPWCKIVNTQEEKHPLYGGFEDWAPIIRDFCLWWLYDQMFLS